MPFKYLLGKILVNQESVVEGESKGILLESLVVRLSGQVTAENASRLYLECKDRDDLLLALDFEKARGYEEPGKVFLEKLFSKFPRSRIALVGFPEFLETESSKKLSKFSLLDEAKVFLEMQLESKKRTNCPKCGQELNIKKQGDYECPNCFTRFYFKKTGRSTAYEKLF